MPDQPNLSHYFATRGMNAALDPSLLDMQTFARGTNIKLFDQLPRTRWGCREIPMSGPDDDVEAWRELNTQGATFFNPAKGQGALVFGKDQSQILEACGGRKFALSLIGRGGCTYGHVKEITNGVTHDGFVHLAWWCQAEKYAITCDGKSLTWIWDGSNPAFASEGYNEADKEASKVPNAITAMVYAHGRIHAVTEARKIYVGDSLHRLNQSSPENLLQFTEQVYFATGQHFVPPSAMGNILAGGILPLRNTTHGHAEILWDTEDGVFSLFTNLHPRSAWSDQALTKHALLKTGAVGPYASDMHDGDRLFRSRHGIQTLRSAAAQNNRLGSAFAPISEKVADFMIGDNLQDLRFCSLVNWTKARRMLCTVYPLVRLRHRFHRGCVVMNWNPTESENPEMQSWEGLWTLPPQWGYIVQFVNGIFTGEERLFAICWNPTLKRKTLIEFTETLDDDMLEDGTRVRISAQFISRAMTFNDAFAERDVSTARLYLKNARGTVDWGVWYRINGKGEWTLWRQGQDIVETVDYTTLEDFGGSDLKKPLGQPPADISHVRNIQFLVRVRGAATIEGVKTRMSKEETEDDYQPCETLPPMPGALAVRGYDDYEYASESNRWEAALANV